jgi:hypothetical protein
MLSQLPFLFLIVSTIAPGCIGNCCIRMPTDLYIAFATAAGGGTMLTSPTPRTPKG